MTSQETTFVRVLGRWDVLAVAFGAMIGFGWVVLTGEFLDGAGTLGAALAFVIGGVIMVLVGLTYAELASAMPAAGGEHNYLLRGMGSRAAFVTSWALVLGYVSVVAFEAVALPSALQFLVPQLETGRLWSVAGSDVFAVWVAVGLGGAVVMTALNYLGVRPAAVFQSVIVIFLLAVGAVLLLGSFVGGDTGNMEPVFGSGLAGMVGVLVAVPFLFVGFDVIPQSAEEINLPSRLIGKLLVVSVMLAAAWYVLIMVTVGSSMPAAELAESDLAAADGMAALWNSQAMGNILGLGGVAGILTSWNAFLIGASRLVFAMARSGMLPAWFSKVHPQYRTPSNAILFIGALSVISPFFGEEALVWLVDSGGLAIIIAYILVATTFLVLRRREPEMERPFRLVAGPVIGALAVVLSIGLAVLFLPGMPSALVLAEWIILAFWVGLGLVFFVRLPGVGPGADAEQRLLDTLRRR
ncbi:MAG: amino acid permease [Actinophytocola sp.]|nr:amino acid permease [Actinophytocola sp.]